MPTHTVAFAGQPNVAAGAARASLPAVLDTYLAVQGGSGQQPTAFLLPGKMHLVASYAIGQELQHAQVITPSLLAVGYPFIRPLDNGMFPVSNPNVQILQAGGLELPSGEPVSVAIDGTVPGNAAAAVAAGKALEVEMPANAVVLLWLHEEQREHDGPPEHQHAQHEHVEAEHPGHEHKHQSSFWLRYTLAANGANLTPYAWNQFAIVLEQSLPAGTYDVVGFEHIGGTAIAARLIFPGSVYRPGTVAIGGTDAGVRSSTPSTQRCSACTATSRRSRSRTSRCWRPRATRPICTRVTCVSSGSVSSIILGPDTTQSASDTRLGTAWTSRITRARPPRTRPRYPIPPRLPGVRPSTSARPLSFEARLMPDHGDITGVSLPAGMPSQLLIGNARRSAVLFSPPAEANAVYTLSTDPNVSLGNGLNVAAGGTYLLLSAKEHGEAVQKSWFAVSSADATFGYLEVTSAGS